MCGIVGVVNAKSVTKDDVWKMIDCIKYRGVDEQGVEQLGRAVLGHARLAVVDPENGMQPMCNTDGKVWVIFQTSSLVTLLALTTPTIPHMVNPSIL